MGHVRKYFLHSLNSIKIKTDAVYNGSFTLATFVSVTVSDSDTVTRDSQVTVLAFGHLGRHNTDNIVSIGQGK
jgi:hypothetical protein